ncbi:MAG TPA: F0F1 ATP synthase subunit B [Candidatus Pacearchaeota archaeon]|nr:F0F1 ATP synthase subunit B [Candidatus Pacearchaeota archaeon]
MSGLEINWKILLGQIVNFAILFFALKLFVYNPLLSLLKTRREKIEEGVNKSKQAEEKLGQIRDLKEKMERENEAKKKEILLKAQEEAKKRSEELVKKAEEEREALLLKAQKEAEAIKEREAEATKKKIIDNAFLLTEKLLKESIDATKGKEISEDFLSKIKV